MLLPRNQFRSHLLLPGKSARSLRLAPEDIDALKRGIGRLMEPVAETYYLEAVGEAEVIVGQEAIRITVPIRTSL